MKTVIFGLFGLGGLFCLYGISLLGFYPIHQVAELQVFKNGVKFLLVGSLEF